MQGTTVTLTAEKENLYRTSIKQTSITMGKGMLLGSGIGLGLGCLSGKIKNAASLTVIGMFIGLIGSVINILKTGKAQYIMLPQDKIDIENGLARQNLATMNLKEVKNEN